MALTASILVRSAILGGGEPALISRCLLSKDGHAFMGPRPKLSAFCFQCTEKQNSKRALSGYPLEQRDLYTLPHECGWDLCVGRRVIRKRGRSFTDRLEV